MPYALTFARVRSYYPCDGSLERISKILPKRGKIDAAKARELGCTYADIVWIASEVAVRDEGLARRLTAYVNDNAKAVLHLWERRYPNDDCPRKAIESCDAFLAGTGSEQDWWDAAGRAWDTKGSRPVRPTWAAWEAWIAWESGRGGETEAAWEARNALISWDAARHAFHEWQFDRLIYWLTEEEPVPLPIPGKGVPALPEIDALEKK